jgi:hypothetical protein
MPAVSFTARISVADFPMSSFAVWTKPSFLVRVRWGSAEPNVLPAEGPNAWLARRFARKASRTAGVKTCSARKKSRFADGKSRAVVEKAGLFHLERGSAREKIRFSSSWSRSAREKR